MLLDASLNLRVSGYALDTTEAMTETTGIFWPTYFDGRKFNIDRLMKSCGWLRQCLNLVEVTRNPHESTEVRQQTDHMPSIPSEYIFELVEEASFTTLKRHAQQLGDLLCFNYNELVDHYIWVRRWCPGRKFFRTQTGRFGIGPRNLEEGDLVCALYAGRPLFVLRPVEIQGELKQRYRIVGDAYVPGLMQGEGFRGKKLEDMQEFCLI